LVGNPKEKTQLGIPRHIYRVIILKWIFKMWDLIIIIIIIFVNCNWAVTRWQLLFYM